MALLTWIHEERLSNRGWIGHARGFLRQPACEYTDQNSALVHLERKSRSPHNDHTIQLVLALHESGQDSNEIAADSAAYTPVVHLKYFFLRVKFLLD